MNRNAFTRNITGLLILALGAGLLLNALEVISIGNFIADYWPLGIVAAGVLIFINNWRSWMVSAFLVALGALYQLREWGTIDIQPWSVIWPLILIFVGLSIVFGRTYSGKRVTKSERDDVTAIMAGVEVKNHSKSFKQSNATAIMGGAAIDLRDAEIENNALVEVFSFWGGVEIIVPENVIVRNQVNNVMAGTEDKTKQKTDKNSPVLVIAGTVIMAGVSIRNNPSNS